MSSGGGHDAFNDRHWAQDAIGGAWTTP